MKLKTLTDLNIYDEFVKNSPYNHYMKTSCWAKSKKDYTPIYLGFFKDEIMIGTALALKKSSISPYLYIPLGMCIDYTDTADLRKSLNLLKEFAKKEKVGFLKIDPNVIRVSRDIDGRQTDEINNEHITQIFIEEGFIHKGYGYAYNGSYTNRYTLIVDLSLSIDELKSNYSKARISAINRHKIIGVSTRLGTVEDIPYLMEFEKELSSTQGFKPHSYTFFKEIFNNFNDNARLYVTEVDLNKMIAGISDELNSKKYAKDLEARLSKEKELETAKALLQTSGSLLVIAAGLFLYYGEKSWDLYTYNRKTCNFIKPTDNLHYFAMNDLKNLGVKYYDMCGFSGSTDKKDPYYGLYSYKKSFNPSFIEMIGEFDYIINPLYYKTDKILKKGINKLRRKINSFIFKKN